MTATIDHRGSTNGDEPTGRIELGGMAGLERAEQAEESERIAGAQATVASEKAPLPKHDLPVLEAFRGIASVMVVVTHVGFTSGDGLTGPWAGWLSRLDFGVALFFLLSGFLLFRPFVQAAYGRRPTVAVKSYLRRRFVRIYPGFLFALVICWLIVPRAREMSVSLWVQTVFMVQNYPNSFMNQLPGMVQLWSLVVEVSFYLALPFLAWMCLGRGTALMRASERAQAAKVPVEAPVTSRRAARRRRQQQSLLQRALGTADVRSDLAAHRPGIMLAVFAITAITFRVYYLVHTHGLAHQLLWLPAFLDWFSAGMVLAWLRERDAPVPTWIRYLAQFPGVCWSIALAGYWLTTTSLGGPTGLEGAGAGAAMLKHVTYIVIAVLLLLPAVFGDPTASWRRVAANRFFTWLGQVSFGIFLWHPMLMIAIRHVLGLPEIGDSFWLTLSLTLITSSIAGTVSWRYVEEPLQRRWRNGFRIRPTQRAQQRPTDPPSSLRDLATN
jgi:peptidoglycan/LPS O-acetylase OafA/YrhL